MTVKEKDEEIEVSITELDPMDERVGDAARLPFQHYLFMDEELEEPSEEYPYKPTVTQYKGVFIIKRLTIGELQQYESIRVNQLSPGSRLSFQHVADALAYLAFAVVKAPDWWKPQTFHNGVLVLALYRKVNALHANFRVRVLPQSRQSS